MVKIPKILPKEITDKYKVNIRLDKKMKLFQLELTNYCNAECSFCNNKIMKRKKGFISLKTVRKVIKLIKNKQESIDLVHYGESLLHPKFFEIVKLFSDEKIKTGIYTNGKLLTSENIDKIANSQLAEICISMNYFNPRKEVEELVKKKKGSITVVFLKTPKGFDTKKDALSNDDMLEFIEWAEKIGIRYRIDNYFNPVRINGKYGCADKYNNGDCLMRKRKQAICLWNETLIGCKKDYDSKDPIGKLDNLLKLKYKNSKCPY